MEGIQIYVQIDGIESRQEEVLRVGSIFHNPECFEFTQSCSIGTAKDVFGSYTTISRLRHGFAKVL